MMWYPKHEREKNSETCHNMDRFQKHYDKWKIDTKAHILYHSFTFNAENRWTHIAQGTERRR
jgi:hypothetical protein